MCSINTILKFSKKIKNKKRNVSSDFLVIKCVDRDAGRMDGGGAGSPGMVHYQHEVEPSQFRVRVRIGIDLQYRSKLSTSKYLVCFKSYILKCGINVLCEGGSVCGAFVKHKVKTSSDTKEFSSKYYSEIQYSITFILFKILLKGFILKYRRTSCNLVVILKVSLS